MPFQFTAAVSAAQRTEIVDAYCTMYHYSGVDAQGSPETKMDFFQRRINHHIREPLQYQRVVAAEKAARDEAVAQVESDTGGL